MAHRATSDIQWVRAPSTAVFVSCMLRCCFRTNMLSLPELRCTEITGMSSNLWRVLLTQAGVTRAIGRDTEVFPDPDEFKPSRWLDSSGKIRDDTSFFNYGFGRR